MSVRNAIYGRLYKDLVGPTDPEDSEQLTAYPTDVYLTGILFPQNSGIAQEEADQLQSEGSTDADSNDVSKDEVSLATVKRPSSAGLSFVVEASASAPQIAVTVEAGRYEPVQLADDATESSKESDEQVSLQAWQRIPVLPAEQRITLDFSARDIEFEGEEHLGLHIRTSPWGNKTLVTVAMLNTSRLPADYEKQAYEECCLFQTHLTVKPADGTRLSPRPVRGAAIDEDTRMAALIYRDVVEYAVGHTCSAVWPDVTGEMTHVESAWIPKTIVKAMSASGVAEFASLSKAENEDETPVLSTTWLSDSSGDTLIDGLRQLPDKYSAWLASEAIRVPEIGDDDLEKQAKSHIEQAEAVRDRMNEAIDMMADPENEDVQKAFRLANRAIRLQRQWGNPGEKALIWRPFQLGFILLSLSSLSDEAHDDRHTADLLWFPTGGGKTEAYLGLVAFLFFLRRLRHGAKGAGVSAIMRYTLRLLTTQQFQRAAALVCACEAIRQGEERPPGINDKFPGPPFSLGLWVGGDATPNRFDKAKKALGDENAPSRPDQLKHCPRHRDAVLIWKAEDTDEAVRAYCPDPDCLWHKDRHELPVWTVDTDVYRERPSLLLGTVDKFAQVARNANTSALFGLDADVRQPDLIIQDELHLISGPLGTLVGLYEVAIDKLCSRGETRPKVIASTATIRQASAQIRALFDRDTCLFPPPVIDASNSGFAVEDPANPGRQYLGITTAGRSAKFTLQAAAASLLQSVGSDDIDDQYRDDYWTLVAYFNSLRELGGALVLMQDDVPQSLDEYSGRYSGEETRTVREPVELTSRVSQAEIKDILATLERKCGEEGACDLLLASNMISVGVDVPRLGMMVVNGQPKGIAEYIQATSRVGRRGDGPGGFVVTLYNNAKSRDRSHYESFLTWHKALYREVEATSVTPFAARAREKALHAVLVILARHLVPALNKQPRDVENYEDELESFVDYITDWAQNVDKEEADNVTDAAEGFAEHWKSVASDLKGYWSDMALKKSLLTSAEKAAEIRARSGTYNFRAEPTPNSMRNVEPATMFKLAEKFRERQ